MERVQYFPNMPQSKIKRILKAIYLIITNFHISPIKILKSLNIFKYGKRALSLNLLYWLIPFLGKKFDIIHCHFGPNGIIGIYLKDKEIGDRIITTFYGYDVSSFISGNGGSIYKDLFLNGSLFLPICDYFKRKLIDIGCDERKIIIHRIGVDFKKFKFSERKIRPKEPVKILTIARLVGKKGHKYAIRAIAKIIREHNNIQYIIAGDGPLRGELESLVSELGIKNHVKFLGVVNQDECLRLYSEVHIFLLHSVTSDDGDQEGTPVVLMEAQAVGLPAISTFHSGIPEVVIDGKSGFLVPEKDVNALVEKVEYLIEHPEVWPEMGRYGREFVEKRYDIKKLNQQLVEIYQNL